MQKIIPAILTSDPVELKEKLGAFKDVSKWVHFDIMDGTFVDGSTVSLFQIAEAYQYFNLEIHLLVQNPEKKFGDCKEIGAKRVIFHVEATEDLASALDAAKLHEFQIGLGINPETPVAVVKPYIDKLDSVLVMSVHPGAQGREFIPSAFEKVRELKTYRQCPLVGIDGGIGEENLLQAFEVGIDYAIVGSRIVKTENPAQTYQKFERMVSKENI